MMAELRSAFFICSLSGVVKASARGIGFDSPELPKMLVHTTLTMTSHYLRSVILTEENIQNEYRLGLK